LAMEDGNDGMIVVVRLPVRWARGVDLEH
jgi:hypothetical protein